MIRGTIEEKGGKEGTGAKKEPEDRDTTGGAPEELRGGRETPEEEKEGRDKGKGKPGGGKDTVDAEEAMPKEGKREGAEEDDGTDDTPEDTPERNPRPSPGRKSTGSTEGLAKPTNSLKVQRTV